MFRIISRDRKTMFTSLVVLRLIVTMTPILNSKCDINSRITPIKGLREDFCTNCTRSSRLEYLTLALCSIFNRFIYIYIYKYLGRNHRNNMKIASDLKLEHEIFDRINCCRDNSIRCLRKIAPVTKINYATCELLYYACKVEVVRIYYAVVFSVSTQWKDIK